MADDLSVVNSARVSFGVSHEEIEDNDDKLIAFLMKNRHGTPFEHNAFRFHIKAPIFVFREWQRHRIGSFNELSARYKELEPEFYVPERENVRTQTGRPGNYKFEEVDDALAFNFIDTLTEFQQVAFDSYQLMIEKGIAKELARLFLPVSIYSEMYWTVNARSLMNFLSLRTHETAMFEIREYATNIAVIFTNIMPLTYKAFAANGYIAP